MKIKKIFIIILLIVILGINMPIVSVKALTENENITLVKDHTCVSLLKVQGKDLMKTVVYVYYEDESGNKYPAFCVEPSKDGIGTGAGDSYDVTVNQISDNVLWRMLYKGYMGTSYTNWNLECDDDLYYATKTAIHCMVEGASPKDKYEVATRVGKYDTNITLEEVQRRSQAVLNVAQSIYEFGYSGTENYIIPEVSISKNGELKEETINGVEYVVQYYNTTSNRNLSSYEVSISNFSSESKIFNSNNLETSKITNSKFKIAIPKNEIKNNISGTISINNAQVKTYPIFYANSNNSDTQNYVTYTGGYETASAQTNLEISANTCTLYITKIDSETKESISNVTFEITNEAGEKLGEYTTK